MSAPLRIWLICRHFPPAVSGGARRPFYLAQALRARGADVRVLAPALPPGVEGLVAPHPASEPRDGADTRPAARSLRDVAREWLLWPDPDIRWTRRAAAALLRAGAQADWIVTTSPPESIHAAGPALARALGARWCADLRDQWLVRPFRAVRRAPVRAAIERRIASRWLRRADLITAVNDEIAAEARSYAPEARVRVLEHFAPPPAPPRRFEEPGVHVLHTGSFSMSDPMCSIAPTLAAFEAAQRRRSELRLHLVGRLSGSERAAVAASPAAGAIRVHGAAPMAEVHALQAGADALIVAAAPGAPVPPGKHVEYRAAGAPIIATGDGPWRAAIGLSDQDPVEALVGLEPGRPRSRPADLFDADAAAARLLGWFEERDGDDALETDRNVC